MADSYRIVDGKAIAADVRSQLKQELIALKANHGLTVGLAVVLVGDFPPSQIYVRMKEKACKEVGIVSQVIRLDADQQKVTDTIRRLNQDDEVHGILVQLPLPKPLAEVEDEISQLVDPAKDADGLHPENLGKLMAGLDTVAACTPAGVMVLLEHSGVEIEGKRAVVIGRSTIVGKPMAQLLLAANATVTICHSRTKELADHLKNADIVVAAVGRPEMIRGEWLKKGAAVIDVGINRLDDGRLVGDVHFDSAAQKASVITPVPGGVGPMTVAMLLKNTVTLAKRKQGIKNV